MDTTWFEFHYSKMICVFLITLIEHHQLNFLRLDWMFFMIVLALNLTPKGLGIKVCLFVNGICFKKGIMAL